LLLIRPYRDGDFDAVVDLWRVCDLLRPWNDPASDIALCRATPTAELFVGVHRDGRSQRGLIGAAMTGSDGHRGWLYYVAVHPAHRGTGVGQALVRHAEQWLAGIGIAKVEIMIRDDNDAVRGFYERIGYAVEPRIVMSRWLREGHGQR
jgi:ribosomal protein S18 acetylase RimI-like enzyme